VSFLICSIYEHRPQMCRDYPTPESYTPPECTYYFTAEGRKGSCDPYCQAACCLIPRVDGVPEAPPLPMSEGGRPCKYLIVADRHPALEDSE